MAYVAPIAVTQAAGPGPVDQTKLQQINPGVTTESEVRSLLGEPTSAKEKEVPAGKKSITYIKILKYGPAGSEVSIVINKMGIVSKIVKQP